MSQTRLFDTGAALTSSKQWEYALLLNAVGVYDGFDVTATGPEEYTVAAGGLLFPSGIAFRESEPQVQDFTNPIAPTVYTIAWRHEDGGFIGGQDATLELLLGKQEVIADGVALAFISHPGVGVLSQSMIVMAPKVKAPDLVEDIISRRPQHLIPPFQSAISTAIPGETTIPGFTPDGSVTYTATVPGPSPVVQVRHVVAGLNTPLTVTVSPPQVTVNLATDGSGVAISTGAQVVAAILASAPALALLIARTNGTGIGLAAAAGFTSLLGGLLGQDADVSTDIVYLRDTQRSALRVIVGPSAIGPENYILLFRFLTTENRPQRLDFSTFLGALTVLNLIVRDTLGNDVLATPSFLGPSAGWVDTEVDLGDGTFTEGDSWFLQLQFTGPPNSIMLLSGVDIIYDAIAVV